MTPEDMANAYRVVEDLPQSFGRQPVARQDLRLPPHNFEAETLLLGAILANNRAYASVCAFLKPEHFADDRHGRIYEVCGKLIDRGQSVSVTTIKNHFEQDASLAEIGGVGYLAKLLNCAVTIHTAKDHGKLILDLAMRRQAIVLIEEIAERLHNTDLETTANDIAMDAVREIERLSSQGATSFKTARQVREEVTNALARPVVFYPTGIGPIDEVLGGGLYPGKAVALCGRFKSGKTLVAGQISQNLGRAGVRHLYVAGEMGSTQIETRALAVEVGVNSMSFLRERDRANPGFVSRVGQAAISGPDCILYSDVPGLNFDMLRRVVTNAVLNEKVSGIVVDYLQLIGGQKRGQSRVEHLEAITQWLADFANRRGIWILCLAQINQDGGVRHGEGLLLAFDLVAELRRQENGGSGVWLETIASRYSPPLTIGSEMAPALHLETEIGPCFKESMAA